MSSLPKLTNYLDATQFLRDYYAYRKSIDGEFSYQTWARELGFKNRSFLRLLITGGRQITESSRKILEKGLGLRELEKDYFRLLVEYTQERDAAKKKGFLDKMVAILRVTQDLVEPEDHMEFLAHPHIPALQVLLSFEDTTKTPEHLAHTLGCDAGTISEWLALLERLGLAQKSDKPGHWVATAKNFRVPERLGSCQLKNYHASVMEKARHATEMPADARRFRTLIIGLSKQEYESFCSQMNEFALRLMSQFSHAKLEQRDLYFYTSSLFPIHSPDSSPQNQAQA